MFWRAILSQWGQSVMLFGLLGAYIISVRNFTHQLTSPFWINLIAFANLATCSLNLATVTTRFVFPQFSLEGQRLWIVGMSPMGLERVVKTKYWLSSTRSLTVYARACHALVPASMKMTWTCVGFFGAVITVMTSRLQRPRRRPLVLVSNLKEANPSKIVSGFGGTLLSRVEFFYILASVLPLGFGTTGSNDRASWAVESRQRLRYTFFFIGWVPLETWIKTPEKFRGVKSSFHSMQFFPMQRIILPHL